MDAKKSRLGRAEALALAKSAARVVAIKGKSVVTFDMKTPPSDVDLLNAILGPTGNLRAPTVRVGKTLLVGFDEAAYRARLR